MPLEISKRGGDYRSLFTDEPTATQVCLRSCWCLLAGLAHAHTHLRTQGRDFEPDVEVPLSILLDHIKARPPPHEEHRLYLAQKGVAEVLPGLEQQLGSPPFPEAQQRLTKSSIWLGPQVRANASSPSGYSSPFVSLTSRSLSCPCV